MHKAHWGYGFHLKFDRTVETIKDLEYCWETMQKDVRKYISIAKFEPLELRNKNRIHHIRGSLYHPQSQEAVEAFNRTVQNDLYL